MDNKFRNFQEKDSKICETYANMLQLQKKGYVLKMKKYYSEINFIRCSIWDMINKLEHICDESDPDNDLPQIVHVYQTALSIEQKFIKNNTIINIPIKNLFTNSHWIQLPEKYKNMYNTTLSDFYKSITDWEWFPVIGLIHDLGKILLSKEFGGLPQWSVVGDTFPIGEKLSTNYPFYNKNYHKNNIDLNINTYQKKCGFENVLFSWGHDEYFASVLDKKNNTQLPDEAIYIIRFHSFYSWHSPRNGNIGYIKLADNKDWYMLPLLKAFQKSDLYSKSSNIPIIETIKDKYNKTIHQYIKNGILQF